jgi:hypothetical protein
MFYLKMLRIALLFALAAGFLACGSRTPQPVVEERLVILDNIARGKRFLSTFDGKRAQDNFLRAIDYYPQGRKRDELYCQAAYGVMLANAQMLIAEMNSILGLALRGALSAPEDLAALGLSGSPYLPANEMEKDKAFDFGILLENRWFSLEEKLYIISAYGHDVTATSLDVPDCGFDIGVEDNDRDLAYVLNMGHNTKPIVQAVFRGRLDVAEARVFNMLARTLTGSANFVLAHDLSMTVDVAKIAHMFGFDCFQSDLFDCLRGENSGELADFREWAFLFQDNPRLLGKSEDRWEKRFTRVDTDFANGFGSLLGFFDALISRSVRYSTSQFSDYDAQHFIIYRDRNSNERIDGADTLGLNIEAIVLDPEWIIEVLNLPKAQADKLRADFITANDLIKAFLPALRTLNAPSSEVVEEINAFSRRVRDNMLAVKDASQPYERIPFDSFEGFFDSYLPIPLFEDFPPNWVEIDLASYFIEPQALEQFIPYWAVTSPAYHYTGAIFLIDQEEPFEDDDEWTWERELFPLASYNGGRRGNLTNLALPFDCMNESNFRGEVVVNNQAREFGWPSFAVVWPDPTFNGTLYIDLGAWTPIFGLNRYVSPHQDLSCDDKDLNGFFPPTNYALTKGMWQFVAFVWGNSSVLRELLGSTILEFVD